MENENFFEKKCVSIHIYVYFDVWLVSRRKIIKTDFDDDSKVEAIVYCLSRTFSNFFTTWQIFLAFITLWIGA